MLKIIKFAGGLGNQMFQYAFYVALRKKHPYSFFLFDTRESLYCHNGYELPKIFVNISDIKEKAFYFILRRFPRTLYICRNEKDKNGIKYDDTILQQRGNIKFNGFWQTEKYFSSFRKEVLNEFRFDQQLLNEKTKFCVKSIEECNAVSIHIRRGDYIQEPFRLTCDDTYYLNAIRYIKENTSSPHFYIFSDDQEYVRKLFQSEKEMTFVDWNRKTDSWQDMYLMSKCKHNIIANSSFSWWGAWLNENPTKIVIAPKPWFKGIENDDIVPDSWMRM